VSAGALVALTHALSQHVGDLAAFLRTMRTAPHGAPTAVAASEQAVWTANRSSRSNLVTAVYPPGLGPVLDYPYVVRSSQDAVKQLAATLLAHLAGASGHATLAAHGFRAPDGAADFQPVTGVDPAVLASGPAPTAGEVAVVVRMLRLADKPSRLLALIDVSGSMASGVPGESGRTRIDVARDAAAAGLRLLPDDSAAGLWRFSSCLTTSTDYDPLVDVAPLTRTTRRELADAVRTLNAIMNGGTGLYDSILAAVRAMRATWDPSRVNSVVVLTDGKDEDGAFPIPLERLLSALERQRNSDRPVKVIAIAYGPDTDLAALQQITDASGGILYRSTDPRDLPKIFANAIGRRLVG
jgi:hypothetical protein